MLCYINFLFKVIIGYYIILSVHSENVLVKVSTKNIVNDVSDKFISFSVDPKVLLEMKDESKRNDYMRMAKSLSPAYIRIAGPSTNELSLENSIRRLKSNVDKKKSADSFSWENQSNDNILTNIKQWKSMVEWVKTANFTPFIALNNAEKIFGGNWNPKEAIKMLSMVDKMKLGEFVWQLGYECIDQTCEKYLNDLKTLNILMDAFNSGKNGNWKIASGDITKCLGMSQAEKLYTFLLRSNTFLDAVVLNSDNTADPLDIMEEKEKQNVQKQFAEKNTQLWMSVGETMVPDDEEAINWLNTLGEAALDGYSVVFKELTHSNIQDSTLSFYVSLLHKKLVGSKVLEVSDETASPGVSVYAQCTNLEAVTPGALTVFATNEGSEKSLISIKIEVKENNGEIIQYVLHQNNKGKIIVNGKEMENEGDLQPTIKRVKAFKTLTVSMPPKSIGFWVITKANVKSCVVNELKSTNTEQTNWEHKKLKTEDTTDLLHQVILEVSKGSGNRSKRSLVDGLNQKDLISDKLEQLKLDDVPTINEESAAFNEQGMVTFKNVTEENVENQDIVNMPLTEEDITENKDTENVNFEPNSDIKLNNTNKPMITEDDDFNKELPHEVNIEESTVMSTFSDNVINDGHNQKEMSNGTMTTEELSTKKKNIDDIAEPPNNYRQEIIPYDEKNLTIFVVEPSNSTGASEGFGELFSILGQIASMLQLEKEFLDIGSAVLTPEGGNHSHQREKTISKELGISESEKKTFDDFKQIKKNVLRVKRDVDEEALMDDDIDQKPEADTPEAEEVVESSANSLRFALPSRPILPSLPQLQQLPQSQQLLQLRQLPQLQLPQLRQIPQLQQLPQLQQFPQLQQLPQLRQVPHLQQLPQLRQVPQLQQLPQLRQVPQLQQLPSLSSLSNLPMQKFPQSNSIDDLVLRAQNLVRNINPNLIDSARSENRIDAHFTRVPLDTQDLDLKSQLAKNKFKIEELRNKIQARMADYELKTKQLLTNDSTRLRLFKREATQNMMENGEVKSGLQKNYKKSIKPMSHLKKTIKQHFNKLRKAISKKGHFKESNKYKENKIVKENYNNHRKSLRTKRYIVNNEVGTDMSNDIFGFGDFDYKEEKNKDSSTENKITDTVKKTDNSSSEQINNEKSNIIKKDCNNEDDSPCKAKTNLDNSILKLNPISKLEDTFEETPETKVRCQRADFGSVQSDKFTWEDVKSRVGLSDESALNVMIHNVTSFFQDFPKKVKDFWERLGG